MKGGDQTRMEVRPGFQYNDESNVYQISENWVQSHVTLVVSLVHLMWLLQVANISIAVIWGLISLPSLADER